MMNLGAEGQVWTAPYTQEYSPSSKALPLRAISAAIAGDFRQNLLPSLQPQRLRPPPTGSHTASAAADPGCHRETCDAVGRKRNSTHRTSRRKRDLLGMSVLHTCNALARTAF